ncbi:GxxExxY protein [Patescibacteria group bacterium]|jgi:ATP-dependent DNA helicase RecG|nr:GxxExxY protein [Patescibacteria group bacterium]
MQPADPLTRHFRLTQGQKRALAKLNLTSVGDLLYHAPTRWERIEDVKTIEGLVPGDEVVVYGRFSGLTTRTTWKSRRAIAEGFLEDGTGRIKVMWFNQPYLAKMLVEGVPMKVTGAVGGRDGKVYLANPEAEPAREIPTAHRDSLFAENTSAQGEETLFAVYPESKGITSAWFRHALERIFQSGLLEHLDDPLPPELLTRYHLPALRDALIYLHTPKRSRDAEVARKRFAFQEVFLIQLGKMRDRHEHDHAGSLKIEPPKELVAAFTDRFPFALTQAQHDALAAILADLASPGAMARLVEGDVGSGKTAVAATVIHAVTQTPPTDNRHAHLQCAYMCPTEILAKQHFASFIEYFHHTGIQIGLLTSSGCQKYPSKTDPEKPTSISKAQLLKWVASGEVPILIGTHALIQKSVSFKNLGLVVIDEQHRFGTSQRLALARGKAQNERRENAEPSSNLLYKDLTYKIRRVLFQVKKELGSGHKEVVYQRALAEAFAHEGLLVNREVRIPITYQEKEVGVYVPDFVIDDTVILELKAQPFVGHAERKQLWSYLKGSSYRLGLLANFGPRELTIDRIVYDTARSSASPSASDLRSSAPVPHLLSMTATPIPRTLALTIFGDLDLTVIDQMPTGRKPIITTVVKEGQTKGMYESVRGELSAGRQVYVICPRIDEPDPEKEMAIQATSAVEEAKRLQKEVFPEYRVGLVHSKLKPAEKEEVMNAFARHELDILVATSVVEVGVNVPNATVIIIEGAERFGLAQLHQLRGRVIRSNHQAYCFAVSGAKSKRALDRLKALTTAKNGFELAEHDLKLRGPGELYGRSQSGLSDLGMDALKNLKLVEAARQEAKALIDADPSLAQHPDLATLVTRKRDVLHGE